MIVEPALPSTPAIDHRSVDWSRVRRTSYDMRQRFTYEYPGPIRELRQRLVVVPGAAHGDQRLLHYELAADGAPAQRREEIDRFGNRIVWMAAAWVERRIDFSITLHLERSIETQAPSMSVAEAAAYLVPTELTAPGPALIEAAHRFRTLHGEPTEARAARINAWVFETMQYARGVTGVRTTATEALSLRAGVCQDFAHVMLAVCRLAGIPARYVSGHLLGEGGTHAWVEVLVPSPDRSDVLIARAFDPTHGRRAGLSYITVATGRDYRDVAPTTGSFLAPYGGVLTARKSATITRVDYAEAANEGERRGQRSPDRA